MKIAHCNANRRFDTYVLHADNADYKYLTVYKLTCPKCKRVLVKWQGVKHNNVFTPVYNVKGKDVDRWLLKIKINIAAHSGPIVSEATIEMSKDVATVWERILNREKAEIKSGASKINRR